MEHLFHNILSPIEFEEESLAGFEVARKIAQENDATIYLLHVIPTLPAVGDPSVVTNIDNEQESVVRKRLTELAEKRLAGVNYQILIHAAFFTNTARAVLLAADQIKADLIVMATHGRAGIARFLLGSVTDEVVRKASCPVLTVRPSAAAEADTTEVHPSR